MTQHAKLIALCFASLATLPASAQVITNGSFEAPTVPVSNFTNFPGGSTAITGWTVVGVETAVVSGTFNTGGITFQAQSGNQWLDLTGGTSNSSTNGVAQNVATTIGNTYRLEFFVGSVNNGSSFFPSTVDLSIDGGPRNHFFNPNSTAGMINWQQFSFDFLATTGSTSVTFFNGSAANNSNTGLDNVTIATVPEPSSMVLAVVGLGLGRLMQRRRRAKSLALMN